MFPDHVHTEEPAVPTLIDETEAHATHLAVRLVAVAETLGLVPTIAEAGVDRAQVLTALDAFAQLGVGRTASSLESHVTPEGVAVVLREVLAAVEESPMPDREWAALHQLLGDDLLAATLGVSSSSLHRYRHGTRTTPDRVAARLHFLVLVVADLRGSYNDFGVRRWFQRPRAALGGRAPVEILAGDWAPSDPPVQSVRELAGALFGASAG